MKRAIADFNLSFLPQTPKNRRISIGCIGSGFIMRDCQIPAYRQAGLYPVAVASRNESHALEVAKRYRIEAYKSYQEMLKDTSIPVIDIAVPPDIQYEVICDVVKHSHIRGILAQKPLGMNYAQALEIVQMCEDAGINLVVNQNMRYDQSVRACKSLLDQNALGEPVFATLDMRAIPHWMPWQERLGWATLRILSIHHLDAFRFWFGDPVRIFASMRPDPRTEKKFAHQDGICTYILEYENGLRVTSCDDVWTGPALEGAESDIGINWRIEGTEGLAKGTIGWHAYPRKVPSTLEFTTIKKPDWQRPRWKEAWFPDAFAGPMCELLVSLETSEPANLNGRDNLKTIALVDACYLSAKEHRAVEISEITGK